MKRKPWKGKNTRVPRGFSERPDIQRVKKLLAYIAVHGLCRERERKTPSVASGQRPATDP